MTKPRIKISLNKIDWMLETTSALALIALILVTIYGYRVLPENIPLHFNLTGEADGFGSKQSILIIPIATLVIYLALTILERFPHKFNYMLEITAENAERQYRNMHYMMKILKVYIVFLFLYVTNMIVQIGSGNLRSMSNWILPVILVGLLSIVIIFIYRGYRLK
jgi:uncharacterized membrane protein